MPNFTDLTGLAGLASATAAGLLLLLNTSAVLRERFTKPQLSMLLGIIFVLMLAPFAGMPLAAYVRGMTGDLSITTLVLVWSALLRCRCDTAKGHDRFVLSILISLAAAVLYPMALGVSTYDPYRLGYGEPQFIAVLMLLALAAWFWRRSLIAACIAFAVLAWAIGWYESSNLWDYLLDPFVSVYALAVLMNCSVKTIMQRSKSSGA